MQEKQCSQTSVSFHPWRANTFWSNRMSQTLSIATVRRQEARLLGDDATAR